MRPFVLAAWLAGLVFCAQRAPADITAVWVAPPSALITPESTAPADAPAVLRMVTPRGGFASGQVVVRSSTPLQSLLVKASDLVGPAALPAAAVQIRFPSRKVDLAGGPYEFGTRDSFDALSEQLAPGEMVQPVWITVSVPQTATAGAYKGQLDIGGRKVPLELTVGGFAIGQQRALVSGTIVSPESIAMRYGVAPYSDANFKLLEPSLRLQGHLGNNVLYVPVVGRSYLGNRFGLIQFRRAGARPIPDFTAFDRYLALYTKYCGAPRAVVLYVWEKDQSPNKGQPSSEEIELTIAGGAELAIEKVAAYPANKEIYRAVLDGAMARLEKLSPTPVVLIGQACDQHPSLPTVQMFHAIAPALRWSAWTHGYGYRGNAGENGNDIGLFVSPDFTPEPKAMRGGWNDGVLRLNSLRSWVSNSSPPARWRVTADLSCGHHKQGVCAGYGMVGLDYFPLPPKPNSKRVWSLWAGPYPGLSYCRLDRDQASLITAAGKDGALSTVRLEMLAEGAQEAEARIAIEKAVSAKQLDAKQAGEVLLQRIQAIMTGRDWDKDPKPDPAEIDHLGAMYQLAGTTQK